MKNVTDPLNRQRQLVSLSMLVCFCYLLVWVFTIPFDAAPDEELRYLVPHYIYEHLALPTGFDEAVIYREGYYSYAFYPQLLGSLVSAFLMRLGQFLSFGKIDLIYFARLTSVLSGLGLSYIFGKTVQRLTNQFSSRLVAMFLIVTWPQLTFLSAYLNNDIIGLFGAALVIDSMVKLLRETEWRLKDTLQVALGYVICLLGYLNAYPIVLFSSFYFLLMIIRVKQERARTNVWVLNHCLVLALLMFLLVVPFFARNYLLYGDWLGNRIFEARNQQWLLEGNLPTLFPYREGGMVEMILSVSLWESTLKSLIGTFGYMTIWLSSVEYVFYLGGLVAGLGLFIGTRVKVWVRQRLSQGEVLFSLTLTLSSLVTVLLFLYRSFKVDYQAQGRYIIMLLLPLFLMASVGYAKLLAKLPQWVRRLAVILSLLLLCWQSVSVYQHYIYQSFVELGLRR